MTGGNYDSDDACNLSPPLEPQHPDYSIRESPVPFLSDNSQSPERKPSPAGPGPGPDCKRPRPPRPHHHHHPHRPRRRNPNSSSLSAKQILMSLGADQPNLLNEIVDGPFLQRTASSDSGGSEWDSSTTEAAVKHQDMSSQQGSGSGSSTATETAQHALQLITKGQGQGQGQEVPASSSSSKSASLNVKRESQDDDKSSLCRIALSSSSSFSAFDHPERRPEKKRRSSLETRTLQRSPLPPITTDYPGASRTIATSPKLRPFAISPSKRLATETLPALQSPPQSATANSPETSLPSLKATFPDELAESRVKDQGVRMNGASSLYLPVSSPPQSRSSLEPSRRQSDQHPPRPPPPPLQQQQQQQQQHQQQQHQQQQHQRHQSIPSTQPPPPPPPPTNHYMRFSPSHPQDMQSISSTPSTAPSQTSPFHVSSKSEKSFTLSCETPSQAADTPGTGYPTPIEPLPGDSTEQNPRHHKQPSSSGIQATGTYRCTHPGCTAPPFQTQYLLNSHANVHSQDRPFFCPVGDCPRSEGGKGFKRKNEMIRHGLVHESPGYVCPFCHDQQHRYPRPDNLQRHVRVHHVDRNKDDPLLRRVLSQRPEGLKRGRKRRS